MIRIEGLRFAYPGREPALAGVDLAVGPGEYVLLAGPSGSGKSTLLKCLNGLIPHFHAGDLAGRVVVAGRDVADHPPAAMFDAVGLVPQNAAAALFNSTVENEIAFGLESLGVAREDIGPRVAAAAAAVGLSARLGQAPHTLSGGEQGRLAVAAALAARPGVLALDEPFAQLDPEMAERLRLVLKDLAAAGVTVVVAEHRLGPVVADAGRLVVLESGRVVRDGPPGQVLAEDLRPLGINLPLPVRVAHELGLAPVPLTLEALVARLPAGRPAAGSPPADAAATGSGLAAAGAEVLALAHVDVDAAGVRLLSDVSLAVAQGETAAVLGRNGAGKTTLLLHLDGLCRPPRGQVRVLGRDIAGRPVSAVAREVGLVFQNPGDQLFRPTVREELEVGPRAVGRLDRARLDDLVARFGLGPLLDRSPFRLSEGEKKRVSFAAALAAGPPALLLDEPSIGQDETFRAALVALLADLAREGRAVLVATHDLELADQVAGRWIVLAGGRVAADGAPAEVVRDPAALAAAGLRPGGRAWLDRLLAGVAAQGGSAR